MTSAARGNVFLGGPVFRASDVVSLRTVFGAGWIAVNVALDAVSWLKFQQKGECLCYVHFYSRQR